MAPKAAPHWKIRIKQGTPRGGLNELEQTNFHQLVDLQTGEVRRTWTENYEASLATDGSGWTDVVHTGIKSVELSEDGASVIVTLHDGPVAHLAIADL